MQDTGWFKSSYSNSGSDACVEVRHLSGEVGVRDTKARECGVLWVTPAAWGALLAAAPRR